MLIKFSKDAIFIMNQFQHIHADISNRYLLNLKKIVKKFRQGINGEYFTKCNRNQVCTSSIIEQLFHRFQTLLDYS